MLLMSINIQINIQVVNVYWFKYTFINRSCISLNLMSSNSYSNTVSRPQTAKHPLAIAYKLSAHYILQKRTKLECVRITF